MASAVFRAVLVYTGTKLWQGNVLSRACLLVFFGGRSQCVFSRVRVWATVSQLIRPLKRHSVTCPIFERHCVWKKNHFLLCIPRESAFRSRCPRKLTITLLSPTVLSAIEVSAALCFYCWTKMCISNVFPTKLSEVIVDHIIRFNGLLVLVVSINIFVLFSYYYQQNQPILLIILIVRFFFVSFLLLSCFESFV